MFQHRQREIVIEFEKVQTIRKRARTVVTICGRCRTAADAVLLKDAAELFDTEIDDLFRFINDNDCHYHIEMGEKIFLCVPSLMETMQRQNSIRRLTAGGE